jgi:hypothetical protein
LNQGVNDGITEAVIAQAVAQHVEPNNVQTGLWRFPVEFANAAKVQPLGVYLKVVCLGFWQWDALFTSFFSISLKSGAKELRRLGCEGSVKDEVLLFLAFAAHRDSDRVEKIMAKNCQPCKTSPWLIF